MAVYKVPQNVEAEDKLLGPLTFKQFIFMLVAGGATLMAWFLFTVQPFLIIIPLPLIIIFGGLAVFRREDQPVERYLLSFFNFMLRPRVRVWTTEGYYEHLIITAPKKQAQPELKRNVSEVHGQLEKLAQLVDTRGWSAKRPGLAMPGQSATDDRLFFPETPQAVDSIPESEDIMDDSNPEVAQLDTMLEEQSQRHKQELLQKVRSQAKQSGKSSGTPRYDPYPVGMTHQRRIDPDGSNNMSTTKSKAKVWTVYRGGRKISEHKSEEEAYAAFIKADADKIFGPDKKDATAAINTKHPAKEAHPLISDTSDIMELSDQLKVSQIAEKVNRKPDQNLKEGEEIKLR